MRPQQLQVVFLLENPRKPDHIVACLRTGYAKSHIMKVLGVYKTGFTLIFIPLLVLSADVVAKFKSANQQHGKVRVFHLDDLNGADRAKYRAFLSLCSSPKRSCQDTNFVFLSPQILINHPDALKALLCAAGQRTLRLVVIDEAHPHVQHGELFRQECRALTKCWFAPIFHPSNGQSFVRILVTTATLPNSYGRSLSQLTTVQFPFGSVVRGTPNEFAQREIRLWQ